MTARCRAAVFLGGGEFEIREFPVPTPPPGGAVLQVEAVGLCGSDLAQITGVELIPGASIFPVVPGHEIVGRLVEMASDAEFPVAVGDRVAVNEILVSPSGVRVYGYSDMTGDGTIGLWGGYGEYMEIFPGTQLFALPDDRPAQELTVFESLSNAVNWVTIADVVEGDAVVVQGPGHQGLAVVEAVRACNPSLVIVTGTSHDRLRLEAALELGASATIMVDQDDVVAAVRELTGGVGADKVFDVSSSVQAVPLSLELARHEGTVLLAGLKHFVDIPGFVSDQVVVKGLKVIGGSGFTPRSMERAVELLRAGQIRTDVLAGEVVDIDHLEEGLSLLDRRITGRDAVRVTLAHAARFDES